MQVILFKIDTYLPLEVWKKCPFVYTGPNFAPFQVGLLPGVLQYQGNVIQRFYPLTVYWEESNTQSLNHLFAFCFLYPSDDQKLGFYVTPICWLRDTNKTKALDFFMTQIGDLARELKACSITMEINSDVTRTVAFPTSLSPFSYDLEKRAAINLDEPRLTTHGFQIIRSIHCYEQNLTLKKTRPAPPSNYIFREIPASQHQTLAPSITQFQHRAYTFTSLNSESSTHSEHLDEIKLLALKKQGWFKQPELSGYMQWTPNLFEPSREYHLPVPLIFRYATQNYPYNLGKVIDWGFNAISYPVISTLLDHVGTSMQKRGITHLQIGGVLDKSELQAFLISEDFLKIHTIQLVHKQVN